MDGIGNRAHVVNRVDETGAEELEPDAVGGGAGEERVVARRDPVSQLCTRRCPLVPLDLAAIEERGLDDPLRAGHLDLVLVESVGPLKEDAAVASTFDAGKERGHPPELVALPLRERMVVALRTLEANSEEGPRCARRQVFGLSLLRGDERERRRLDVLGTRRV